MLDALQEQWDRYTMDRVQQACMRRCSPQELGEDDMGFAEAHELWPEDVEVGGPGATEQGDGLDAEALAQLEAEQIEMFAERRMWAIRQLLAEQAKNDRQHDEITAPLRERIAMAERWRDEQNASLQQRIDYLSGQVEQAALAYPWGKQKSRKMPAGTFGKRAVPEKLEIVDKDAAVAWAEQEGRAEMVRVSKAPEAKALKEFWQSTGTVPAGCEPVAGYDKPFVTVGE